MLFFPILKQLAILKFFKTIAKTRIEENKSVSSYKVVNELRGISPFWIGPEYEKSQHLTCKNTRRSKEPVSFMLFLIFTLNKFKEYPQCYAKFKERKSSSRLQTTKTIIINEKNETGKIRVSIRNKGKEKKYFSYS